MKRLIAKILSAVMLASLMPAAVSAQEDETNILYEEYFESETTKAEIENKQYGWSYDGASGSENSIAFQVEDKFGYEDGSSFLRFASTDFFKTVWMTLDLEENGVYKMIQSGAVQADAETAVADYLSKDMSVSFKAKFETDGYDASAGPHEAYIRVKNADYAAIAEIRAVSDMAVGESKAKLSLRALNSAKNAFEDYPIKEIDFSKENTDWHDFKIDLNFTDNTYRVTVDGAVFGDTPYGEWIPAGKENEDGSAQACSISKIQTMETGHSWSGWWQCLGIDDIVLTDGNWSSEPSNTISPDVTASPAASPTPAPSSEFDYIEDFETSGAEQTIKDQKNGWSYDGSGDGSGHINLWIGNNGSGSGNSLRFASDAWFKTMWLIMNLKENAVKKQTAAGKDADTAAAEMSEYLSSDFKLSFDAKFEQQGTDSSDPTENEQYIRIKGSDNHAIAELHLYNDTLGIIALNSDKNSNEFYEIKKINWTSGSNDWHHFAIYFNHAKEAYLIEVDGEMFKGTPHGRWIPGGNSTDLSSAEPAPLGEIGAIEFGHYYSAYWQNMSVDNVAMSKYDPIEDVYEIGSIVIRNEHGGTVLTKGSSYSADVNATGGETTDTQLVWEYSADNKATWLPLTQSTVPGDATHIRVTVTCTSTDGKIASGEAETEISSSGAVDYTEILSENFEASDKEEEILNQRNGWSIKGQSSQVKVGTGFGGTRNSLRFASTDSNVTSNLRLDFMKRGASFETNDKLYLKIDFSFGIGSDDDTINSASLAYVRIKDTNNRAFTTVSLLGDKMYMSYYDPEEGKNKQAVIAQGQDAVLDIWRTMELYLDTEINKYCMLIDGKAVGPDGMKWFTPSDTIVTGIGKPNTVTGIGAVEIGQENSAWWENTCIDNISLQKYYLPAANTLKVDGITLLNGYDNAKPLVTGGSISALPQIDEDTVLADEIYSWQYYNGSEWKAMEGDKIPADAEKIRVNGTFTDVYGQTDSSYGEAEVSKNSAPVISDFKVIGTVENGQTLKPEYTYYDAEGNADTSVFIWSQSRTVDGNYKEISREKEYEVTDSDVGSYIMLTFIPRDDYGVCADTIEYYVNESETSLFYNVWKKISIPNEPSGDYIDLPDKDDEHGITFKWSSSDTSLISDSGAITRPSYGYKTVMLTCTAVDKYGNTERKTFTVTIKGSKGTSVSSGGGGGGGSSVSSGSNALIPHANAAPIVKWTDDEENGGNIINKKYFNDIYGSEWYAANVFELKDRGIVSGDENGNFRPDNPVTRAEFVKMIVDLLGIKEDGIDCEFDDVAHDAWYYPYIASAVKFGIIRGMGDGSFGTELNISRQDMAVIAASAIEMVKDTDNSGDLKEFFDANAVADYAVESVKKIRNAGIMQGSDGMFRPRDNATRAEAARVIYMIGEYIK